MYKAEIYTGEKVYIMNNGDIGTQERIAKDHPAILVVPHVVLTDERGECFLSCDPLSRRMAQLDIDPNSTIEEALMIIEAVENADPNLAPPSAEERIAAAMEYQILMSM